MVVETQTILSFFIYVLVNAFTPGPGNILALNITGVHGWGKSRNMLCGIFSAYYIVQIVCAIFVFGLSKHASSIVSTMKYFGAVYIILLAIHILKSVPCDLSSNRRPSYMTGFLLQLVNIKIYLFGITALTGYITPHYNSFGALFFAEIFIATIGTLATLSWAFAGNIFQKFYLRHFVKINVLLALLLAECAISMLLV